MPEVRVATNRAAACRGEPISLATTDPAQLMSRAEICTDIPARYAKQLVAHLGRK